MVTKQKRFDALVNALYADIYRYAYWLTGHRSVAEDLVQETYLRAWRCFESLKDEKSAKAWLITIVRRENARRFSRFQPQLLDVADLAISDDAAGPGQTMDGYFLHQAIADLALEFREPLVLQVVEGFSTDEIATILDTNRNTVLTRLHRARKKLKESLSDKSGLRGNSNG